MKKLFIPILLLSSALIGCNGSANKSVTSNANAARTPASTPSPVQQNAELIFDLPAVANKSASEVDTALGKPVEVTPIPADRELAPGEYRDYKFNGIEKPMQVRFHKGKAVHFVFWADDANSRATSDGFVKRFGLDAGVGDTSGTLGVVWKGTINGVNFKSVNAQRESPTSGFGILNAVVEE